MSWAEFTVEILRILLGSAPVAAVVVLIFGFVLRKELRSLMARVATLRFPGGELVTTQVERESEQKASGSKVPVPQIEGPSELPPSLSLSVEDQKKLMDLIRAERARAAWWEYRFLNLYLVPNTQLVLDWLATLRQRATVPFYDAVWTASIPVPEERNAIIGALRSHHLIDLSGELIQVTPKGHEYREWRGPSPKAARDGV